LLNTIARHCFQGLLFLTILGTVAARGWAGEAQQENAKKPNVIFILTDDQGYGDLACHGNPVVKTPHLDALHDSSVHFDNFHVSPCCSLTRASLMTGRYATRTGVWHTVLGRSLLNEAETTLADVFRASGYRTAIFGKWHLGDNRPSLPEDNGFDEVLVHHGGGIGNTHDYWANDYFDDTYFRNGQPEKFEGYCTDIWFAEAQRFIEANRERPFFCYLSTNAPHSPYVAPDRYVAPYREQGIEPGLAEFLGMITNLDENIGRLRAKLAELALDRDTILIFMTDNGTSRGHTLFNAGMRGSKGSPYEGGHRVPFFVHWPAGGMSDGRTVESLTAGIDLLPTLVDLCGLKHVDGPPIDGTSLVPLLTQQSTPWPERTLFLDNQRVSYPIKWRNSVVLTDRWRLLGKHALYDIQSDAGQQTDVSGQHPEVVARLRSAYEGWWSSFDKALSDVCPISIGTKAADPVMLTSHDLHGRAVWNQDQVLAAKPCAGYWEIDVECDGLYEFRLRRWPDQVTAPITGTIPVPPNLKTLFYYIHNSNFAETHDRSAAIRADYARLQVGSFDQCQSFAANATEVVFRVPLSTGNTRLQATFVDGTGLGNVQGVYYVYAQRIEESTPSE